MLHGLRCSYRVYNVKRWYAHQNTSAVSVDRPGPWIQEHTKHIRTDSPSPVCQWQKTSSDEARTQPVRLGRLGRTVILPFASLRDGLADYHNLVGLEERPTVPHDDLVVRLYEVTTHDGELHC